MPTIVRLALTVILLSLAASVMAADLVGTIRVKGQPQPNREVKLRQKDGEERTTSSNSAGKFVFAGIAPGDYELSCGGKGVPVRVGAGVSGQDCEGK
ncbi:MAG: carboxypeptidase-like regulatory domain-containing protein [Candidatus Rokuibacteriota bacterium]